MTHPSDDVAFNLGALFVAPVVDDAAKQTRINAIVAAGREFADKILMEVPTESADRQEALSHCRMAFERAVIAVMLEPSVGPPEEPELP